MIVGGIAAAVNIASRILFSLAVSYEIAIVLAFFCGLVTGFLLNRAFVFKSAIGGNTSRQAIRFTGQSIGPRTGLGHRRRTCAIPVSAHRLFLAS
jgi:putative flippase GtrA